MRSPPGIPAADVRVAGRRREGRLCGRTGPGRIGQNPKVIPYSCNPQVKFPGRNRLMTMTWRVSCPTLVGRAEQLAGLRSAIAAASRRRISLMLVGGAAGMGKTRLIGEAADWAATIGHAVIEG